MKYLLLFTAFLLNFSVFGQENDPKFARQLKRQGHDVLCAAINKYGIQYATGGTDKQIVIWDAADGSFVNTLKGHSDIVLSLDFSPDGSLLASASKDNEIRIWDILSTQTRNVYQGHDGSVSCVRFSADGNLLVSGSKDKTVKIWDLSLNACKVTIGGFDKEITSVDFSPTAQYVAVVSADRSLRFFEANSGEKIGVFQKAHKRYIRRVVFSPDGKFVATAADDGVIKVWDFEKIVQKDTQNALLKTIKAHGEWIQSLDFSSDSKYIVSGGHDGKIKLWKWNSEVEEEIALPQDNTADIVYDAVFSFDGKKLVTAHYHNAASVWDISALGIEPSKEVFALSRGGTSETEDDEEELDIDLSTAVGTPQSYLLVIGVDKYKHWSKLNNAVKDAKDFKNVLHQKYSFKKENIVELYDQQVTKAALYSVFDSLLKIVKGQDELVIYYSGHGEYNAKFKQGFWIPFDGDEKNRANYFSNTELLDFLGAMKAKHIVLIADACFSGALFSGRYQAATTVSAEDQSRWGLTSGNKEKVSDGALGQNSPFAKVLLQKLQSNTQNLPSSQLINEVVLSIKKDKSIKQEPLGEPLRLVGHQSGEFVFKVKK